MGSWQEEGAITGVEARGARRGQAGTHTAARGPHVPARRAIRRAAAAHALRSSDQLLPLQAQLMTKLMRKLIPFTDSLDNYGAK